MSKQFCSLTIATHKLPPKVVDVDHESKRTDGTRKRQLPSGFSSEEREETKDYRSDHALTEDTHDDDASTSSKYSVKKRRVGNAIAYKKALRSRREQRKLSAVKEKEFDGDESEDVCSICLEGISTGMRVAQSPCSHIFHRDCLFRWLPRDSRCPMCRKILFLV